MEGLETYIELPPLNVLASLLASDHDDQLADLGLLHPSAQLVHDLLDIRFHLVIAARHHRETIFLDPCRKLLAHTAQLAFPQMDVRREILWRVDAALEEDRVACEVEELGDGLAGSFQCEFVRRRLVVLV